MVNLFFSRVFLFLVGYEYLLPISADNFEIPALYSSIKLGSIFLYEIIGLFIIIETLLIRRLILYTNQVLILAAIALLATFGIISAIYNGFYEDILKALRIFYVCLITGILFSIFNTGNKYFLASAFILGALTGALVNVYFSFSLATENFTGLILLLGQNGPGCAAALSFNISLLIFLSSANNKIRILGLLSCIVFIAVVILSFSKIAQFMLIFSLTFSLIVLTRRAIKSYSATLGILMLGIVMINLFLIVDLPNQDELLIGYFIKLNEGFINLQNDSVRLNYFVTSFRIAETKLFGSSISGFMQQSQEFIWAFNPDDYGNIYANPHNAILTHLVWGGFLAGITALFLVGLMYYEFIKGFSYNSTFKLIRPTILFLPFGLYIFTIGFALSSMFFFVTVIICTQLLRANSNE